MKKNRMMRLASGLLVAVLATTSVISGTYAKYTTQDSANDSARVAKWGVELQVAGDLYSENYASGVATTANVAQVGVTDATVATMASGKNLVAPGTKNDNGLKFSLNGQPEVSGTISATIAYENIYLVAGTYGVMVEYGTVSNETYNSLMSVADVDAGLYTKADDGTYTKATAWDATTKYYTLEDYVVLGADYYPVEYQLKGSTAYNAGYTADVTTDTLAGIAGVVKTGLFGNVGATTTVVDGKTTVTYTNVAKFDPKTDLATTYKLSEENIVWKWDFENDATECNGDYNGAGTKPVGAYCGADTILGNLQAVDGSEALNGEVVKAVDGGYKAPVAAAGTNVNDYNLETEFSLNITVTQVD